MKSIPKKVTKTADKKTTSKKVAKPASTSIKVTAVAPKKVAKKKITKAQPKKELTTASNYNSFWMNDGQILNTLIALEGALKKMDSTVYRYHTNYGRHDFANWVEDVLHDVECATDLRSAKTVKQAHTIVVKHLKFYL